jgi:predicted N-acetyltransferase YhbS
LLGRLAVDNTYRGQSLGAILLADACKRIAAASQTLAVTALVVDAKSAHKHFGFFELPGQPGRWMLPKKHFVS